jgi:hypothetical protein
MAVRVPRITLCATHFGSHLLFRYYIAILAAARHACPPLLLILETDFLVHGGDRDWLQGIHRAPPKLQVVSSNPPSHPHPLPLKPKFRINRFAAQRLGMFNALLAHTPWKLRPDDVELLMRRGDPWSQVTTSQRRCLAIVIVTLDLRLSC